MLDYRPDYYPQPWGDTKILGKADCFVPTERGTYRVCMGNTPTTYSATASLACLHAFATTLTDGSKRFFVGGTTDILEGSGTGFTSRRGATYSASDWWFTQCGDVTVATNIADSVQSTSSGAFGNLSGSPPKAKIAVTQSNAVLLFNINDGSARNDGYATSDIVGLGGSPTTWTVAATNECKRGRFTDTPGPLTNAVAFRDGVLAFKKRGVWFGKYVGRPLIWRWELVSDKVGCASTKQGGAIVAGETCYFGGDGDVFAYDGVQVRSIANGMGRTLGRNAYPFQDTLRIQNIVEKKLLVFWWNVGGSDKMIAYPYNYASDKWGGKTTAAQWFPNTTPSLVIPMQTDFDQAAVLKSVTPQITSAAVNGASSTFYLDFYDYILGTAGTATVDLPYVGDGATEADVGGMELLMSAGGITAATLTVFQGDRRMVDTAFEGVANADGQQVFSAFNSRKRRIECRASAPFILFRISLNGANADAAGQTVYYLFEVADFLLSPPPGGRPAGVRK